MTPILAPTNDATARFDDGGFEWGLELIQVPDVGPIRRKPSSIESWERGWAERARSLTTPRRPRRRLRREIRVAACICLAFAPIATAVGAWGFPPARNLEAAEVAAPTRDEGQGDDQPSPLRIRLSIKPLGAVEVEPESPVVFPGYLLPAERREEASHEGS
jgi:hypothetical protein